MKKKNYLICALVAGGLMVSLSSQAQNKVVRLTTSKSVGTNITLLVNSSYKGVTVNWGDGVEQTYNDMSSPLLEITGQVKGNVIVVSGSDSWVTLACPGNGITDIDLSEAVGLRSLYAHNNEMTRLDLRGATSLTDLNVSGNKISEIVYTNPTYPEQDLSSLQTINLSNNQLTGTFVVRENAAKNSVVLQSVNISGNKFDKAFLSSNANLDMFNCANNAMTSLNLGSSPLISAMVCNDNKIGALTLSKTGTSLRQVITDNNPISSSIDLSGHEGLTDVSLGNCGISQLKMPNVRGMNSINFSGNALTFSHLPNFAPTYVSFVPQEPVDISTRSNVKKSADGVVYMDVVAWSDRTAAPVDLNDLTRKGTSSGDYGQPEGIIQVYSVDADGNETQLVAGKTSTTPNDYYNSANKLAFFNPYGKVVARIVSNRSYKNFGIYIETIPFSVGEDMTTGIENIGTETGTLTLSASRGTIVVGNSGAARNINVYSADGKKAWGGTVGNGTTTIHLPSGIYIVEGRKIAL